MTQSGNTARQGWLFWLGAALAIWVTLPVVAQQVEPARSLETWHSRLVVVLVTGLIVVACVVLHYEALSLFTTRIKRIRLPVRRHILVLIFLILGVHVIEVWIFGVGYYYLISGAGHGTLVASYTLNFLDCIYYSAVCFTTLGLGDVIPTGAVRFVTGTEALTGFVLVTWSASFTFMEMEKFWRE